jgi:hypothetical protein
MGPGTALSRRHPYLMNRVGGRIKSGHDAVFPTPMRGAA